MTLSIDEYEARDATGLRPITAERRDLFSRPLGTEELKHFDGLVFDPPRAGAVAQARTLAASAIERIVSVSCDPASFARDAEILVRGGYMLLSVAPFDQFKWAPHVEIVGCFERTARPNASI